MKRPSDPPFPPLSPPPRPAEAPGAEVEGRGAEVGGAGAEHRSQEARRQEAEATTAIDGDNAPIRTARRPQEAKTWLCTCGNRNPMSSSFCEDCTFPIGINDAVNEAVSAQRTDNPSLSTWAPRFLAHFDAGSGWIDDIEELRQLVAIAPCPVKAPHQDLETSADQAPHQGRAPDVDEGLRSGSTRHSPPAEAQESRGAISPTKTSAEAYRRQHGEMCRRALEYLNSWDRKNEPGGDAIGAVAKMLERAWDEGFEAALGSRSETAIPKVREAFEMIVKHSRGRCHCAHPAGCTSNIARHAERGLAALDEKAAAPESNR